MATPRACNRHSGPRLVDRAALRSITFNEYPEMVAKDRMSVLLAMMDQGVIPVFHHHDVDVGRKEIQACANAVRSASSSPTAASLRRMRSMRSPVISPTPIRL